MRFHFVTLGCPKNRVDTEMMEQILVQAGHRLVDAPQHADVLIVNTCGFIEPARQESYDVLRQMASQKHRRQWLIAAGCLAQRYGDQIRRLVPKVDAIIGTQSWPRIVTLLSKLDRGTGPSAGPSLIEQEGDLVASVQRRVTMGPTAYLKIADGCDAACAFCAIPLIKGPQRSKPREDVLREARELHDQGTRELVLIAQDTTAYGRDRGERDALPDLLKAIVKTGPNLRWLRILYAYPQHASPYLIETMAECDAVCHYLDLPLQHGHPDVLQRMRRPHDVEQVTRLVENLRKAMPDISLRSTFIVGFPGETEGEFEGLLAFMQEMAFDKVGVFPYSREEGTPAATHLGQVQPEVIAERYERAMLLQQQISLARNREQVGRKLLILVEGAAEGLVVGRSYREAPEIDGQVFLAGEAAEGAFIPAHIVGAQEYDLIAERIEAI